MARGEPEASGCSNKMFCYGGSNDVLLDLRPDDSAARDTPRGKPRGTMLEGWQADADRWSTTRCEWSHLGPACLGERSSKVIRASSVQLSATADSTTPQPNAVSVTHLTPSKHLTTSGSYSFSADPMGGKDVMNLEAE